MKTVSVSQDNVSVTEGVTDQSEGPENGETGNVGEAQLQQGQHHDDEVEDVPPLLQIVLGAHGDDLEEALDAEGGREELQGGTRGATRQYQTKGRTP